MTPRGGGEHGSAVVELTILTPLFLVLLMFVVAAGRITQARSDVYASAADAARAASLRQFSPTAEADARATVARSLADRGVSCRMLSVGVHTGSFVAGGSVSVDVTCLVSLSGLGLLGLPGERNVTATATEVVDTFRGTS